MIANNDTTNEAQARPMSPHLQIYRWQWTMVFSIAHRLTGLYISAGIVFLSAKLIALAFAGADNFARFTMVAQHPFFLVLKIIFTWCLLYHMLNGVRHLLWDTGVLLGLGGARASGYLVFLLSLIFNTLYWI